MKFWVRWESADGRQGPRDGPFDHRRDAVRHIEGEVRRFAGEMEHGTGEAGEWAWDATRQSATLYRGDLDVAFGHFVIEVG